MTSGPAGAQPSVQGSTHAAATKASGQSQASTHSRILGGNSWLQFPLLWMTFVGSPEFSLVQIHLLVLLPGRVERSEASTGMANGVFWFELCYGITV